MADVKGYSRLMRPDEEEALRRFCLECGQSTNDPVLTLPVSGRPQRTELRMGKSLHCGLYVAHMNIRNHELPLRSGNLGRAVFAVLLAEQLRRLHRGAGPLEGLEHQA